MTYIRSFNRQIVYKIDGNSIEEFSGKILYRLNGEFLNDFYGRTLYRIEETKIRDFNFMIIFEVDYAGNVKRFAGLNEYVATPTCIKKINGEVLYWIDGPISRKMLLALIAILYA